MEGGIMEKTDNVPTRRRKGTIVDRVPISVAARERLDAWCTQVTKARPGVRLARKDLIEWLILERSEVLSSTEEKSLGDAHYDDLKFLQFASQELRAAKARGEQISLQEFINKVKTSEPSKPRKPREKKTVVDGDVFSPVVPPVGLAYE